MKFTASFSIFVVATMMGSYFCSAQKQPDFRILKTFPVAGDGKWDYLSINPETNNLYVSHGTQVVVLNKVTCAVVAEIKNTTGVHGIAFVPGTGKGYISNGKLNTVMVFDTKTNTELAQIATGQNPDAIMYDPYSKYVFTGNGKSNDMTVINPENNTVVATISLGGKPETAVSDEAGKLYVNIEDKNEIVVIDVKALKVVQHWPLIKGEAPSGLAIDKKKKILFAGCDNKTLVVVNAATGNVIQTLPIGDGCDGVAFDEKTNTVFSANGESATLTVIKEKGGKYAVAQNLHTAAGARTLTIDEQTQQVYLPTAELRPLTNAKDAHAKPDVKPGTFKILVAGH